MLDSDSYSRAVFGRLTVDALEIKRNHAHEGQPDEQDIARLPWATPGLHLEKLERGL